ncbi:unnamed protein product [Vicia faba]|uniref:AB hydrolase-1 domain-containing protein n=1 Tax=Vicia faba TaxID=3906 RepID=A0AAV1AYJ1_VICFA|nr:unnamed protein product [Vicia faba]
MAIITEQEPDQQQQQHQPKQPTKTTPNQLSFCLYFTLPISLITLYYLFTSSPQTSFLNLPTTLRHHYSNGRFIQLQTRPNQQPINIFTFQPPPLTPTPSETVLILHGQALSSYSYRNLVQSLCTKGVRVIAVDLPGYGFSDKSLQVSADGFDGFFGRVTYVYSQIREKGFFWAFDQIVETGQIPYEEIIKRMSERKVSKPIDLGLEEIGKVFGEVIAALELGSVHFVLHDSALGFCANWVSENSDLVSSLTLIDTGIDNLGAFPVWLLEGDANRVLLKAGDGRKAVVAIGKNLNSSFDLAEWGGSDGLKDMPMQLIWASGWSEEWSREGKRVAGALPRAKFVTHSGGRWAQEDVAIEIAEKISQFVLSLPKTVRKVKQESSIPDHIQKNLDEANSDDGHDNHHGHGRT